MATRPIPERGNDRSKMVTVFFCDYISEMSIGGLFTEYLYNLDWDQHAWTDDEIEKDRDMFDWLERD
jgi:hypothetical protein